MYFQLQISVLNIDFETHVFIRFLISIKFSIIINHKKKRGGGGKLSSANKCAVIYYCSGYKSKSSNTKVNPQKLISETAIFNKENSVFAFSDAVKRPELRKKWIKFVNRKNWFPTEYSGVCSAHFDPKFIKHGVRMTLIYDLNLIPTIYSNDAIKFHLLCYYLFQVHQENLPLDLPQAFKMNQIFLWKKIPSKT